MIFAHRQSNGDVAYPLPLHATTAWRYSPCPQPNESTPSSAWATEIELPDLPTEHIVVPSFAMLGATYRFQFDLLGADGSVASGNTLHIVPASEADAKALKAAATTSDKKPQVMPVSTHIDCWHTHTEVNDVTVRLTVWTDEQPTDHLLVVTSRPLELDAKPFSGDPVSATTPASISQMQADKKIANRICSPTSLAMALSTHPAAPDASECTSRCHDPITNAYGSWPLAIHTASRVGVLGAVEACDNWANAATVLAAGTPIVCSIRFAKDELDGAPLNGTGGHLVVLHGIDNGNALVHDPAAPDADSVPRAYPLEQFTRAWLSRRGGAYFFA